MHRAAVLIPLVRRREHGTNNIWEPYTGLPSPRHITKVLYEQKKFNSKLMDTKSKLILPVTASKNGLKGERKIISTSFSWEEEGDELGEGKL
jgi:hypothetical protein